MRRWTGARGPLRTSQLLVGAEMEALVGDTELDGKTNTQNPQGSSSIVAFREEICYLYLCHSQAMWRKAVKSAQPGTPGQLGHILLCDLEQGP